MINIIDNNFMVCSECLQAIANDDYTGLDYYLPEDESNARMRDIQESIHLVAGNICCGDSENDDSFSMNPCDCCGDRLHGSRHHCVLLER